MRAITRPWSAAAMVRAVRSRKETESSCWPRSRARNAGRPTSQQRRWAKVGRRNSRPIENLLGHPMVLGRVTRLPARRDLRHVDNRFISRLLRGLGEIGGRIDNPWRDGMQKISRADPLHGGPDVVDVGEVTDGDFDSTGPQGRCLLTIRAHICPHRLLPISSSSSMAAPPVLPVAPLTRISASLIASLRRLYEHMPASEGL